MLAIAMIVAVPLHAVEYEARGLQTLVNFELSYGARYRVESSDPALIGFANGGERDGVNSDDGTLNYDTGSTSQMVRGTAELIALYGNFSFYGRAAAFHDWEQQGRLDRTALSGDAEDLIGTGVEMLDHYFGASYTLGGIPVFLRVGDQVVNWSGTTYLRDGLDLINPVDFARLTQPVSQVVDARTPQGMVWFAAGLSDVVAVEGYYQYEWKAAVLPPIGSYLSGLDAFGGDGLNSFLLGGGAFSDIGTDLDGAFGLPAGTLGFDEDFFRIPGVEEDNASDSGQFGLAVLARWLGGPAPKLGLHYMRYHSRLPILSTQTGDAAAVAATSAMAVAQRAASLVDPYLDQGLDIDGALQAASATSQSLTISQYANAAGFNVEYPEDIHAVGVSLSMASLRTGTLFSAELSRHFDVPYQLSVGTLLNAALSPIEFDPGIGDTPLGDFGAGEVIRGFRRGDRTQAVIGLSRLISQRFGADALLTGINLGWVHVHDAPGRAEVPYEASGTTNDSWGAQVYMLATYNSVIGGLNLTPRISYSHDIQGTTPAPISTYLEGRSVFSLGLKADLLQNYEVDLSYVRFMGGGAANLLRDRDNVQVRISVYF